MAQKLKRKNGKKKNVLTTPSKINVWLRAFLDDGNPDTFMNRVASVRAAGYKCASEEAFRAMGTYLYQQTQEKILSWMDEVGLSEPALKAKALSLFEANQKALEKMKGRLTKASPGLEVIAETTTTDSEGNDTTELWLSSPVPALETQRKTLDMAFRVRGMYAPEKREITGKDGAPIALVAMPPQPATLVEWTEQVRLITAQSQAVIDVKPSSDKP